MDSNTVQEVERMGCLFLILKRKHFAVGLGMLLSSFLASPAIAAELLLNPRAVNVSRLIAGQSPTRVISDRVNVRNLSTTVGNGGFVFARLDEGDEVYVLSCEGFNEGYFWVRVWIPEIGETGYVVAEYLQNNYQRICDRTRRY
ncbi:MAG: hypothetical protein WBA10_19595 [Elainellaceae cyanobacterium]